jgi:class 3 adenylate cyclase
MRASIQRFNEDQPERSVSLKIGIHHGAAIAVTLNDQLDYFGHTVNIASRVQEMADAAEIWVTDDVLRFPGVQALLQPYGTEMRQATFAGVEQPMSIARIGGDKTA